MPEKFDVKGYSKFCMKHEPNILNEIAIGATFLAVLLYIERHNQRANNQKCKQTQLVVLYEGVYTSSTTKFTAQLFLWSRLNQVKQYMNDLYQNLLPYLIKSS